MASRGLGRIFRRYLNVCHAFVNGLAAPRALPGLSDLPVKDGLTVVLRPAIEELRQRDAARCAIPDSDLLLDRPVGQRHQATVAFRLGAVGIATPTVNLRPSFWAVAI